MSTKIDTKIWVTQKALADQLGVNVQNVHNWIKRNKIESKAFEFLPGKTIILVNKNTITVKTK